MRVLITGGAGFIGSACCRHFVAQGYEVLNLDKLTYAGDLRSVESCSSAINYRFVQADVADRSALDPVLADFQPDAILHLAAESHVDRSIDGPAAFVQTNLVGTFVLLEAALSYWRQQAPRRQDCFRFLQVSTDEVYGSLGPEGSFVETTAYQPNSPYSASKAGADHLARAWHRTYGLPVLISNCSNNYGPFQHPEKLIPTVIRSALNQQDIPIYGTGRNVRDWLFVDDHVRALEAILLRGRVGEKYNIGGGDEAQNIDRVRQICALLDDHQPRQDGTPYADQIRLVQDRPGHDLRNAISADKLRRQTNWTPLESGPTGLLRTVRWYLEHRDWLDNHSAGRLGLGRS
ncbi:MAG: dTDP-glucose 4,6-dehydratase [Rickettsiales bacterium]|nr:dTDP-glucose 4,6-dehydratase [Rickettsiales bacterium]